MDENRAMPGFQFILLVVHYEVHFRKKIRDEPDI
jgi:hypothetical protein